MLIPNDVPFVGEVHGIFIVISQIRIRLPSLSYVNESHFWNPNHPNVSWGQGAALKISINWSYRPTCTIKIPHIIIKLVICGLCSPKRMLFFVCRAPSVLISSGRIAATISVKRIFRSERGNPRTELLRPDHIFHYFPQIIYFIRFSSINHPF